MSSTFNVFNTQLSIPNIIAQGPTSEAAYPRSLIDTDFPFYNETTHRKAVWKNDILDKIAVQLSIIVKKEKETTISQRLNFEASASIANNYDTLIQAAERKLEEERVKKLAVDALYRQLTLETAEMESLCREIDDLKQSLAAAEHSFTTLGTENTQIKSALNLLESAMQTLKDELAELNRQHQKAKDELAAHEAATKAKFEKLKLALESGAFSSTATTDGEDIFD